MTTPTFILADRVKETATVSGSTTPIQLLSGGVGAQAGFTPFSLWMSDAWTTLICVVDQVNGGWATYGSTFSAAAQTISRDEQISSCLGGTAIYSFAGNACDVFMDAPASRLLVSAAAPLALSNGGLTLSVGAGLSVAAGSLVTTNSGLLEAANNLSDVASLTTARTNLGLGGAALLNVGTAAGTVAAGNDSRLVGAAQTAGGSFVAQLQFGGGNVGMVSTGGSSGSTSGGYGEYSTIGNVCFWQFFTTLTNKGTSTGTATVLFTGLPAAVNLSLSLGAVEPIMGNVSGLSGTPIGNIVGGSSPSLEFRTGNLSSTTLLTDANFTNTSVVSASGFYFTS